MPKDKSFKKPAKKKPAELLAARNAARNKEEKLIALTAIIRVLLPLDGESREDVTHAALTLLDAEAEVPGIFEALKTFDY